MRLRRVIAPCLALCACLLTGRARAYVTSATLEFFGDDKCGFYLNGRQLLDAQHAELTSFWWDCLSTSDGSLPLELFNSNGDNLLAAVNYDLFGGSMYMAYRLTVHHSSGDPVVIFSDPEHTKFLNVPRGRPAPQGWFKPGFDDSAWPLAVRMNGTDDTNLYSMPDPHFEGFFGQTGFVPFLCHNANGKTNPRDFDLYRTHFSFPNAVAPTQLILNPPQATRGGSVAVRVLPGRDIVDLGTSRVFVLLPPGMLPRQISSGGVFDPKSRSLYWDVADPFQSVQFIKLPALAVDSAPGWEKPEKALGPYKPKLRGGEPNVEPYVLEDTAAFYPQQPAWYRLAPPPPQVPEPRILGVIFRAQMKLGGADNLRRKGAAQAFFNYSVDGSTKGVLARDVQFSQASNGSRWIQGYYDASEDRNWTWADLKSLKVRFESHQAAEKAKGRLGSIRAIVKAYNPAAFHPSFVAEVAEPGCKTLELKAGVMQVASRINSMDSSWLPVNQNLCVAPPTPTPMPTPKPIPGATPRPVPTPTAGPSMGGGVLSLGLGCLQSSPEPFKAGGAFVYFCLKAPAKVTLKVYDLSGRHLRSLEAGDFRAGAGQLFFNGLDDSGRTLPAGSYTYEVMAGRGSYAERKNAGFSKAKEKGRR